MEGLGQPYAVRMTGSIASLDEAERTAIDETLREFVGQHGLAGARLHVDLTPRSEKRRGEQSYASLIRLQSILGEHAATEQAFGALSAVNLALANLKAQVRNTRARQRAEGRHGP